MNPRTLRTWLGVAAIACSAAACDPDSGGNGTPDAGTVPDAGPAPATVSVKTLERLGDFAVGRPTSVLTSAADSTVLVGLSGATLDETAFGLEGMKNEENLYIPSGLLVLDSKTGAARVLTSADGLPEQRYADGPVEFGTATAPFFSLAWIEPGKTFVGAAWDWVVKGTRGEDGAWTFENVRVRAAGAPKDAFVAQVAVAGAEVFVGCDQGLAVLDAATLDVKRWVSLGAGPAKSVYLLASGELAGAPLVAMTFASSGAAPTHVAVVRPGDTAATTVAVDGAHPTALLVMKESVVVGVDESGKGAIRRLVKDGEAWVLRAMVGADELAKSDVGMVIPNRIAWDAASGTYVVGGWLRPGGKGGGLVRLQGMDTGEVYSFTRGLVDRRDAYLALLPRHVDVLHVDADGRLWTAGKGLCSEHKLRQVGLWRMEDWNGRRDELRVSRPWLSGVRALETDPDGATWVGLVDEISGLACDGASVQQAVCRLRADGSCEVYTPFVNAGDAKLSEAPAATAIAFGDQGRKEFAIATHRDALYLRKKDSSRAVQTQFDPGLHLKLTSAEWDAHGALWVGSATEWQRYDDPTLDDEAINARSPHGVAWLEIADDATIAAKRRYVRVRSDDATDADVAGLPSNHVWDVLPLGTARSALVATGVERRSQAYDHLLPEEDESHVLGGLALVSDAKVDVVAAPEGVTFRDVVSLARAPGGAVYALDAEAGVFSVDLEAKRATRWAAAAWQAPVRGLSLAVDADGRVAVGTTRGLFVYSKDKVATKVDAVATGYVWTVRFTASGVLEAGSDRGLVRASLDGLTLPRLRASDLPYTRELWELPHGCDGEPGCACTTAETCAPGFSCIGEGDARVCGHEDPCVKNPGASGCVCRPGAGTCGSGLTCACSIGFCTCEPPPPCADTCECLDSDDGCPEAYECVTDEAGRRCAPEPPPPACLGNCSCTGAGATTDGCMDGYACQSGIMGSSCVKTGGTECLDDCSCTGEGATTDGCMAGWACQAGIMGDTCVESGPPECAHDCSCAGPDATADGCVEGYACQGGIMGSTCVAVEGPPECASNCSCAGPDATADGCVDGYACQGGIMGSTCVAVEGPPACASNCSCTGPDATPDGCVDGYACQGGIMGSTCVETEPVPECANDCTCTGPDTFEGCPNGMACGSSIDGPVCM